MIVENDIVVISLHSPKEQLWGVVESVTQMGVTLRAININSFRDWCSQIARDEEVSIGLITTFFPMYRVEKLFLDEDMGIVKSLATQFKERIGISVEEFLAKDSDISSVTH